MRTPAIDLPMWTLRCLHSEWIGYTMTLPEVLRDAHITRAQGIIFERWLPSVLAGRYSVSVREVDGALHVGLAVPTTSGPDMSLFELPARRCGVDLDWIAAGAMLEVEDDLAELLGGER